MLIPLPTLKMLQLMDPPDDLLHEMWDAWVGCHGEGAHTRWRNIYDRSKWLLFNGIAIRERSAKHFTELYEALTGDAVFICTCGMATYREDAFEVQTGVYGPTGSITHTNVCEDCHDSNYTFCAGCSESISYDHSQCYEDDSYCEPCFDDRFQWCEDCEAYYPNEENHGHGCECEAPHPNFTFPAEAGASSVASDERITIELPKGEISEYGMDRIASMIVVHFDQMDIEELRRLVPEEVSEDNNSDRQLRYWSYTRGPATSITVKSVVGNVGSTWQTKRGNFTKRLSSAFYKKFKMKLPAVLISSIGNMARANTADETEWFIEFTRDLNQSAEAFANSESCWWQSYYESRCALKNWGGMGIRSYSDEDDSSDRPSGRAWIQPLNEDLVPTHNPNAHAYVVYNCYEDLSGFVPARLVAQLTGKTYKKITFTAEGVYVNGSAGYLVADEKTCTETEELRIEDFDVHHRVDADDYKPKTTETTKNIEEAA